MKRLATIQLVNATVEKEITKLGINELRQKVKALEELVELKKTREEITLEQLNEMAEKVRKLEVPRNGTITVELPTKEALKQQTPNETMAMCPIRRAIYMEVSGRENDKPMSTVDIERVMVKRYKKKVSMTGTQLMIDQLEALGALIIEAATVKVKRKSRLYGMKKKPVTRAVMAVRRSPEMDLRPVEKWNAFVEANRITEGRRGLRKGRR